MNAKPGDFYIGVIDFFGILVPGAVLLYLYGEWFAALFAPSSDEQQPALWVVFAVASYVVGQFLLGLGVPLNHLLGVFLPASKDSFYKAIKNRIDLPESAAKTRTNAFYRAYACVRLESPSAPAVADSASHFEREITPDRPPQYTRAGGKVLESLPRADPYSLDARYT